MAITLLLLASVAALAFSAFFSGTETGLLSVSRERILHLAREGGRKARLVQAALADMDRTTTTLLIGNNISNVSYSAATAALATELFSSNAIVNLVWSFFAAFMILYFSEFIPKLLCSMRPLRRSLLMADVYRWISLVLYPLTVVALKLTNVFLPQREPRYKLTTSDLIRILEDRKDGVCLSDIESALVTRIIVLRVKGKPITPEAILSALSDGER